MEMELSPYNDVVSTDSTKKFKNRLDMFWFNQDLEFDTKARHNRNWKS